MIGYLGFYFCFMTAGLIFAVSKLWYALSCVFSALRAAFILAPFLPFALPAGKCLLRFLTNRQGIVLGFLFRYSIFTHMQSKSVCYAPEPSGTKTSLIVAGYALELDACRSHPQTTVLLTIAFQTSRLFLLFFYYPSVSLFAIFCYSNFGRSKNTYFRIIGACSAAVRSISL